MTHQHPTMQELLSASRWTPKRDGRAERRPVITLSRLPGAGGRELALELGRRLQLEVHDRDIIHRIAHQAGLRERSVEELEEQERSVLTDWLTSFASDQHLAPYGYLQHLTRVVEAIARPGGAVILGRGAHLILAPNQALRVFVVAPLEMRVATVMARYGCGSREAEHHILAKDAERRAFLKRYFRADLGDPASFDLIVNTGRLGVQGAADAVEACLRQAPLVTHA